MNENTWPTTNHPQLITTHIVTAPLPLSLSLSLFSLPLSTLCSRLYIFSANIQIYQSAGQVSSSKEITSVVENLQNRNSHTLDNPKGLSAFTSIFFIDVQIKYFVKFLSI